MFRTAVILVANSDPFPPSLPLLPTFFSQKVWALHQLHKQHGKMLRIGPSHLSISDPNAISQIYSHGLGSSFTKTTFYHSFVAKGGISSLFSDIDPQSHSNRRRAVASVYSMGNLVKLEEFVEGCIATLMKRFDERISEGMPSFKRESTQEKKASSEKKAVLDFSKVSFCFTSTPQLLTLSVPSTSSLLQILVGSLLCHGCRWRDRIRSLLQSA